MAKLIKNLILVIVAIAAAAAVFSMYSQTEENQYEEGGNEAYEEGGVKMQKYRNADLGLSFAYRTEPDGYTLVEKTGEQAGDSAIVRSYVLMNTEGYAEVLNSGIPTEGPPTISVTIFENPDNLSARSWAEKFPRFSLLEIALSPISEIMLGGAPAVAYKADGLYINDMYVVNNNFKIYVIAGGYIDPEDQIREDFVEFLESLIFF